MDIRNQMREKIKAAKTIAIFGHRNPDGDCVGSLLGLGRLLEKQGKKISYFTPTPVSKHYDFIGDISQIKTEFDYGQYDLLLFVDFSDTSRIKEFWIGHENYFDEHQIVVMDHHISREDQSKRLVESDHEAMSACEVIFELTHLWWPEFYDEQIATCFYLGLTTDSGNFAYDIDHKRIFTNALNLIALGANKKLIIDNAIRRKSFKSVKMMERLFQRLNQKGGLVYSRYLDSDIKELGIDDDDVNAGQIVIQDIDEAVVTSIFREQNGSLHGSMRSKGYNVEQIAREFGGGGHLYAAGFHIPRVGSFEEQLEEISTKIATMII